MEISKLRTQSHTKSSNHTQSHTFTHTHTHFRTPPASSIDRAKFLCLLEVHLSASSAAITISGRVILSAPVFVFSFFSFLLLLFLLHLSRYALLQSIGAARGELCDAKLIEQANTNWASFFSIFLLQLTAGFNVRVTQVCAHLLSLCLGHCRCMRCACLV